MLSWYQACPVGVKCRRNKYVSFKLFSSEVISISPGSVPGMGRASYLSRDGTVGCYTVIPFTSVSGPHPIQGDPKHRVVDTLYYIYAEREEKIWPFSLFQQYQKAWQCFLMVPGARRVQQQPGVSWSNKLLG